MFILVYGEMSIFYVMSCHVYTAASISIVTHVVTWKVVLFSCITCIYLFFTNKQLLYIYYPSVICNSGNTLYVCRIFNRALMYSIWYSTCYLLGYIGYISGVQWISSEYSAKYSTWFPRVVLQDKNRLYRWYFLACNTVYDVFYTALYRCILSGILHVI